MQLLGIGFLISIVISLFIVAFFNKENAYFNSSAAGATGKLMIVDQATGAISFVTKSVKGIDDAFTDSDTTHEGRMAAIEARLDTAEAATALGAISGHTTKIGALEGDINAFKKGNSMAAMRVSHDSKIGTGEPIAFQIDVDDKGWDTGKIIRGIGANSHNNGTSRGWMDSDIWVATTGASKMRILRST